jgi:hypothetical protein
MKKVSDELLKIMQKNFKIYNTEILLVTYDRRKIDKMEWKRRDINYVNDNKSLNVDLYIGRDYYGSIKKPKIKLTKKEFADFCRKDQDGDKIIDLDMGI